MRKFKNIILLFVLGVLGLLAACSNDSDSVNSNNTSTNNDGGNSSYPNGTIEIIVPASPGGDTDRNGRLAAQFLEEELGVSVVVQNIDGASGSVGTEEAFNSDGDGNKVLFFHNNMLINELMEVTDIKYSDFKIAAINMFDDGNGVVVGKNSPYSNIQELLDDATENPGTLNLGTSIGSFTYIQIAELSNKTDAKFNLVDSGDFAETNAALLSQDIAVSPMNLNVIEDYIDSGDMIPLALFSDERLEKFPDVPTFKEEGIDSVFEKFFLFAFPPETPDDVVDTFTDALENMNNNEGYIEKLEKFGIRPVLLKDEEVLEYLEENNNRYDEILGEEK